MGLMSTEKAGGGGFEPVPQGTHIARCTTVVDLGVQQTPWGSKEQVYIGFEVPSVRVEWEREGQKQEGPALIGVTWTNNLYEESNLGKNLISWRGKPFTQEEKAGFDLFNLLGVPCMLSVVHNVSKNGKTYANIASIMGMPAGTVAPKLEGEEIGYTATDSRYSKTLDKLPEWLRNKALDGQRSSEMPPPKEYNDYPLDDELTDIPF